jgi:hypothetical protein
MIASRKYILWAILAAMVLFYGGDWLMGTVVRGPLMRAQEETKQLKETIRKRKADLKAIREEKKQLAVWESQSLPADPLVARSLYQAWLVQLLEHVGLVKPNVDAAQPANHKDLYEVFSFTVRGQGTLEQLTQLLFEFYRAGHLHQIRSLELAPSQGGQQFGISIQIEALALPYIKRVGELGHAKVERLASNNLADYAGIARRNVFGGGDPDTLDYTRFTAITYAQGQPQVWFSLGLGGETLQKSVGEVLEIGPFRGRILEIHDEDVILDIDGEHRLLAIGETLSQASALPPGW